MIEKEFRVRVLILQIQLRRNTHSNQEEDKNVPLINFLLSTTSLSGILLQSY